MLGFEMAKSIKCEGHIPLDARRVPGAPDYLVTPSGDVWSTKRRVPFRMKPYLEQNGYLRLRLFAAHGAWHVGVNRLVALAFLGPPPAADSVVMHLDNNPKNNSLENLCWGSQADNLRQCRQEGRTKPTCGERNRHAKLTAPDVMAIRRAVLRGERRLLIARRYGITRRTVGDIMTRSWRHLPMPSPCLV